MWSFTHSTGVRTKKNYGMTTLVGMMLEIYQTLLHKLYKLICHQLSKKRERVILTFIYYVMKGYQSYLLSRLDLVFLSDVIGDLKRCKEGMDLIRPMLER